MTGKEREELIEKMARAMCIGSDNWTKFIAEARAALAVAEPVIREQEDCARLREENVRLREAVKNAYYEGWQDNASVFDTADSLHRDWETSEACAAIREGGK